MSFASITPAQVYATTYSTLLASRMKQGMTLEQARENAGYTMEMQLKREIDAGRMAPDLANQIRAGFATATPTALPTTNPSAPQPAPASTAPTNALAASSPPPAPTNALAQPPAAPAASNYVQSPTYANPRTQAYFDDQLRMAAQYGPAQANKLAAEATQRMIADYPDVYGGAVTQPSAYVAPQQTSAPAVQSGKFSTQKANDYYAQVFQQNVGQYGAQQAAAIAEAATINMQRQEPSVYGEAGWGAPMQGAEVYGTVTPNGSAAPAPAPPPATGYNVQSATQNPFQEAMGQGTTVNAQFTGSTGAQLNQQMTQAPQSLEDYGPGVAQKVAALQLDGNMPYTSLADMAAYAQLLMQGRTDEQARAQIANHYNNPVGSTLDQITQGTLNGIGGAAQAATNVVKPVLDPIANAVGGTIPVIGGTTATPPPNPTDAQMTQQINNAAQAGIPQPNIIPPNPGGTYEQAPIGQFPTPIGTYNPSGGQTQQVTDKPLDPTPPPPTGGTTSTQANPVPPPPTGGATSPPAAIGAEWWKDPAILALGGSAALGALSAKTAADTQANAYTEAARLQAQAARDAAGLQSTASTNALTEQQRQFNALMEREKFIYDQQFNATAPARLRGDQAGSELQTFDQNNPAFSFQTSGPNTDPSYNFRLSEGLKALQNSAAAKGGLLSGNTLKGISDYGQQSASQEYQNAFNRYQTTRGEKLNRLQSLAGLGQTAVQQVGQAGQNYASATGQAGQNYAGAVGNINAGYASNLGSSYTNAANALAAGRQGAADASASGWMGVSNSLSNALGQYVNYNQSQNLMNALRSR